MISRRLEEIRNARYAVALRALEWITDELQRRGTGTASVTGLTDRLDAAAITLADDLRKPETCPQCHQEIRKEES